MRSHRVGLTQDQTSCAAAVKSHLTHRNPTNMQDGSTYCGRASVLLRNCRTTGSDSVSSSSSFLFLSHFLTDEPLLVLTLFFFPFFFVFFLQRASRLTSALSPPAPHDPAALLVGSPPLSSGPVGCCRGDTHPLDDRSLSLL